MIREIYSVTDLPVFQNKMYQEKSFALEAPVGDLTLVQDMNTGLIYNSTFDQSLLNYDQDYQNEQAYSPFFKKHLSSVKDILQRNFSDKSIIEVGCGKGYFLDYLIDNGFNVKGMDPAYEGESPHIIKACFDEALNMRAENIVLRHVLEHIPDPYTFLKAISKANGGKGKIYIEVPCLNWIADHKAWFDLFYEHVNYFRLDDFYAMFENVYESGHVFCGQYIYVVADISSLVLPQRKETDVFMFPENFDNLKKILDRSNPQGKNIIWGGASKGVIFSLKLNKENFKVDYVVDINPLKQGKYIGGTGLEVRSPDGVLSSLNKNDNIFVMNSNYMSEIVEMAGNQFNYIKVD
jgi:SAM-dependent methyltransferase